MQWFKHSSDARNSLKLRKVRRKYGADGYAIYWFCLEAIAHDIDKDNLTFNLKEDAETIGFELTIQEKRVEEIMTYMVNVGLFESSNNTITCLKLAERLDKSMTNSPKMRAWLDDKSNDKVSQSVMTLSDNVKTCAELDKTILDKTKVKESNKATPIEIIPCELEEIKDLYNTVIDNENANWSKLQEVTPKRKTLLKKLISFSKKRIKQSDNQSEKTTPYLERLLSSMADDGFCGGKIPSAKYPDCYKWGFDQVVNTDHIIKFIERVSEEA